MQMLLIAVSYDTSDNITDFRVHNADNGETTWINYAKVLNFLKNKKGTISGLKYDGRKRAVVASNGAFDRYPKFVGGKQKSQAVVIVGEIPGGYRICNAMGKSKDFTEADLINSCESKGLNIANGKIVTKGDKKFISAISGDYIKIANASAVSAGSSSKGTPVQKPASTSSNNGNGSSGAASAKSARFTEDSTSEGMDEAALESAKKYRERDSHFRLDAKDRDRIVDMSRMIPHIDPSTIVKNKMDPNSRLNEQVSLYDDYKEAEIAATVEDKMSRVLGIIKKSRAFYFCALEAVQILSVNDPVKVPTMAASADKIFFNVDFVKEHSVPELVFSTLHELLHILLKSSARGKGKDHTMWNIATDLIINRSLVDEFKIYKKDGTLLSGVPVHITSDYSSASGAGASGHEIAFIPEILYSSQVDLEKDTAEKIYQELMDSVRNNQQYNVQNQQRQGGQGGQGGPQGSQQSQGGQGQQGQQGGQQGQQGGQQGQQGQQGGQQGQQGQQGQGGQGGQGGQQGQQSGAQGGQGGQQGGQQGQQGGQGGQGGQQGDQGGQGGQGCGSGSAGSGTRRVFQDGVYFRGQKITNYTVDVVEDQPSSGSAEEDARRRQVRSDFVRGGIASAKDRNPAFRDMNFQAGNATLKGILRDLQLNGIPHDEVNWKSYITRKLLEFSKKDTSYANLDRRFVSRGQKFPGKMPIEPDRLKNIKICVDVSGSISNEQILSMLAQMNDLFKTYKASGEVMYWDTQVLEPIYPFENIEDIVKARPPQGGGTDVRCVFDLFKNGEEYVKRRKKQPSLIIIFTDGQFSFTQADVNEMKLQCYKDKVLWIINDPYNKGTDLRFPIGVTARFFEDKG